MIQCVEQNYSVSQSVLHGRPICDVCRWPVTTHDWSLALSAMRVYSKRLLLMAVRLMLDNQSIIDRCQ